MAVVGCGYWGINHVRAFARLGALRAVCDGSFDLLAAASAEFPAATAYESLDELLRDDRVEGVVFATPASTHAELAARALESGRDVLVEKPVATCMSDGVELVRLADSTQRILSVGHLLEYHPAVLEIGRMTTQGRLGELRTLHSRRLNLGKLRSEESVLWSFAPHDVALATRVVGHSPSSVRASGAAFVTSGVYDTATFEMDFDGLLGRVDVSWLNPLKEQRFVAVGSEAMLVFDDTRPWPEKLCVYPYSIEIDRAGRPHALAGEPRHVPLTEAAPLDCQAQAFLESMSTRRPTRTDGRQALEVLAVLEACDRSIAQGGIPMPVPSLAPRGGAC